MPKIKLFILTSLTLLIVVFSSQRPEIVSGKTYQQTADNFIYLPMISHNDPNQTPDPIIDPDLIFLETFDRDPSSPEVWTDDNWDLTIHQRDQDRLYEMAEMPAHHGPNCEPPPMTHPITSFEDNFYICKNHMMTANYGVSKDGGYGLVYFAPDRLIDTTADHWFIQFDMSTYRVNPLRNWVDIWIVPFDKNLQLAIHEFDPDLQGAPLEGVQIRLLQENYFRITIHENGNETHLPINNFTQYHHVLDNYLTDPVTHMKQRSTFYFGVTHGRLKVGMPQYDLWWHDQEVPEIFSRPAWKDAAVQFGHHSYTPDKLCEFSLFQSNCEQHGADTFHWDNMMLYPTKPFDLVQGTPRLITTSTAVKTFTPEKPAPAGSYLRFAGIGENLEVSFDSGVTWQTATEQGHSKTKQNTHFRSYWMPVPTGTADIQFRGENWWNGQHEWATRDISIWAKIDESSRGASFDSDNRASADKAIFHELLSGDRDPNSYFCEIPAG